jgi:hypothetical protein
MTNQLNEALLWLVEHQGRITFTTSPAPAIRIQALSEDQGDDKTLRMLSKRTAINSGRATEALLATVQALRSKKA